MLLAVTSDLLAFSEKTATFSGSPAGCLQLAATRYVLGKNLIIMIIMKVRCLIFLKMQANRHTLQAALFEGINYPYASSKQLRKSAVFEQIFSGKNINF